MMIMIRLGSSISSYRRHLKRSDMSKSMLSTWDGLKQKGATASE
jgi:hypothetical protein